MNWAVWRRWLAQHVTPELTHHTVHLARLSPGLAGLRVVQLSDLHLEAWNRPVLEAAVEAVNQLNPDIVVCTGDVIAEGRRYLADLTALLQCIQATAKFACLGNHDYADGDAAASVQHAMARAGFRVLVNAAECLRLPGGAFTVAGSDDLLAGRPVLSAAPQWQSDSGGPVCLLNHNPRNAPQWARQGVDWVLSGHTHGGQIRLPDGIRRHLLGSPFVAGAYTVEQTQLYVNRGLGVAILMQPVGRQRLAIPTVRWAVSPEVSCFTLLPEAGGTTPRESSAGCGR